jgi:FkbH-like protein
MTIEKIQSPSKKVLILDCDNTLWGGVVGEDGYNGIRIGTDGEGLIFSDFQKSILRLKNEGAVLCISSKNNAPDVLEVFNKNKNMILKFKDFSAAKINWQTKSRNIIDLSKELDLSLDSFAFFDDNPLERDQVRKNLPEVSVIEPDNDISNWPHQILESFEFIKFRLTKEDLLKTQQYKNRLKFVNEKNKNSDELNFLKHIRLKANIVKENKSNEQRLLQIVHKTNQFNLTTKRYSQSEISSFKKNKKNKIFLINLNDKYGDHGLVGLAMLRKEKNFIYIDNFAMSCRVLGRHLEFWMFSKIVEYGKKNKVDFLIGEYIQSSKNIIVKDLYKKMKFKSVKDIEEIPEEIRKYLNSKSKIFIVNINKIDLLYSHVYKN